MTSNDIKKPQMTSNDPEGEPAKSKNNLKGGAIFEINGEILDGILHIESLYLELAVQFISNDQTERSDTIQD